MANSIKLIYHKTPPADLSLVMDKIREACSAIYKISPELLLVKYEGEAHTLFTAISEATGENAVLIIDTPSTGNFYWGLMNKNLWEWLDENNEGKMG